MVISFEIHPEYTDLIPNIHNLLTLHISSLNCTFSIHQLSKTGQALLSMFLYTSPPYNPSCAPAEPPPLYRPSCPPPPSDNITIRVRCPPSPSGPCFTCLRLYSLSIGGVGVILSLTWMAGHVYSSHRIRVLRSRGRM